MFLRLFRHTTLCRNFLKSSKKSFISIYSIPDTSDSGTRTSTYRRRTLYVFTKQSLKQDFSRRSTDSDASHFWIARGLRPHISAS